MKTLRLCWQRLVTEDGQTCDRCRLTEAAVDEAGETLRRSLAEMGVEVVVEKDILLPLEFLNNPLESNRLWIADRPLEAWLDATSGQSRCCAACGDADCRTVIVDGQTYEAIPPELIVAAGLRAAEELLKGE